MSVINHQAIQNNWTTPEQIVNPQTLILGSFNPFNANGNIVDYYYGRRSNYFWKRIAIIMGYDEEYFFDAIFGWVFHRKWSHVPHLNCQDVSL